MNEKLKVVHKLDDWEFFLGFAAAFAHQVLDSKQKEVDPEARRTAYRVKKLVGESIAQLESQYNQKGEKEGDGD